MSSRISWFVKLMWIVHYKRMNLSCKCVFISWSLMLLMQTALTTVDHWQKSGRKHGTIGRKHNFIQKWPNYHGYNIARQQTSSDCVGTNKGHASSKANHQRSIQGRCDITIHDLVVGSHFSLSSLLLFRFILSAGVITLQQHWAQRGYIQNTLLYCQKFKSSYPEITFRLRFSLYTVYLADVLCIWVVFVFFSSPWA